MSKIATVSDDSARLALLEQLKAATAPFTVSEMVARSGLPPDETERHLNILVREYESSLDVTEDGDLIYRFDPALVAREDVVKADKWRRWRARLKSFFVGFFKAWTVAMVVVYTIIYVCLIVAAIAAASSQNNDRRRSGPSFGGSLFRHMVFWHWFDTWRWRSHRRSVYLIDQRIYRGEDLYRLDARPQFSTKDDPSKPTLVDRTWYHLFGSDGLERTPLEEEKELLTFIRAKKGIITNADIMALLGVTYDDADAIGTRLVATYAGELDITSDGVAIYRFPELLTSVSDDAQDNLNALVKKQEARLSYTWTIRERLHKLRGSSAGVVPWLNIFNLILAGVTYTTLMPQLGISGALATFGLVIFPGLYSTIFLGLGLRRWFKDLRTKKAYSRQNMRLGIYRLLFNRKRPITIPGDERAIADAELGSWTAEEISAEAAQIAEEIRGDADFDSGRCVIRGDRVIAEMKAAEAARRRSDGATALGRTIFSSDNPALDEPTSDVVELDEQIAALEAELEA